MFCAEKSDLLCKKTRVLRGYCGQNHSHTLPSSGQLTINSHTQFFLKRGNFSRKALFLLDFISFLLTISTLELYVFLDVVAFNILLQNGFQHLGAGEPKNCPEISFP